MTRLCSTHILDHYAITNVDSCFKMAGRAFDGDEKVIEAARVGALLWFTFLSVYKSDLTWTSVGGGCFFKVMATKTSSRKS